MSVDINQIFNHQLAAIDEGKTYRATIRITSDGLSVFVKSDSVITSATAYQWANNCSDAHLESILNQIRRSETLSAIDDIDISIILDDKVYTLVPNVFFDSTKASLYLKYQADDELLLNSVVSHYQVNDFVGVFSLPNRMLNIINSIFKNATVFPYNYALLKLFDKYNSNALYAGIVSVYEDYFDLLINKNGQLIFFNRFQFTSKEDFIYFLAMTLQQLDIKPTDINLNVLGKIEQKSPLSDLLTRYYPSVTIFSDTINYPWDFHRYCIEQKF